MQPTKERDSFPCTEPRSLSENNNRIVSEILASGGGVSQPLLWQSKICCCPSSQSREATFFLNKDNLLSLSLSLLSSLSDLSHRPLRRTSRRNCRCFTPQCHKRVGNMDDVVDHYILLGLPSGEEGSHLSDKEITKAYKKKALELHPDKRPNDRNAHADILRLNASYAILKDATARKLFDDVMRAKRETALRQSQQGSKRRKMVSDLEGREKAAFAPDPVTKAQMEEERITRKFNEEVARIRAQHANKVASTTPRRMEDATVGGRENKGGGGGGGSGLDKEKMLKVSWEKIGEDYSARRLKDLFEKFGEVKDVVIRSSKKKGSAIIEMASKDAAVAATGSVCGDLSNPLLVLPLDPAKTTAFSSPLKHAEPEGTMPSNLVGAGHQLFEDSILKKMMQKAAEKQK